MRATFKRRARPANLDVRSQRASASGFTVIEVLIAAVLLVLALVGFSGAIGSTLRSNSINRERVRAAEAARQTLEVIESFEYGEIFARFNGDDLDDPPGPDPSPGDAFDVFGLVPLADDPDGMVGQIVFPVDPAAPGVLREDYVDSSLGMPRDLNGDGEIDSLDHSGDYFILPLRVIVRWAGENVDGELALNTALADV